MIVIELVFFLTLLFFLCFGFWFAGPSWKEDFTSLLFSLPIFSLWSPAPRLLWFWGLSPPGPWGPQVLYWLLGAPAPQWCWGCHRYRHWAHRQLAWQPSGKAEVCPPKLTASQMPWSRSQAAAAFSFLSWVGERHYRPWSQARSLASQGVFLFLSLGAIVSLYALGGPNCLFPSRVYSSGCRIHAHCLVPVLC